MPHHAHPMALSGLGAFFLFGLTGSLHCIGMCGPLRVFYWKKRDHGLPIIFYHLARISSYALLGGLVFILGSPLRALIPPIFFIAMAGVMALFFLIFKWIWIPPFFKKALSRVYDLIAGYPVTLRALVVGFLTPLLPCGLLYAAVTASLGADVTWQAAFNMGAFGGGMVLPMILAQVGLGGILGSLTEKTRIQLSLAFVFLSIGLLLFFQSHH